MVFFVAIHVGKPHGPSEMKKKVSRGKNDGIVECWNTGSEKRKVVHPKKNVVFTFYDDACQTSISCFRPRITQQL